MGHKVEVGDPIVVAIDGKALFGKVTDTRYNDMGEFVIGLELDNACRYDILWNRIDRT